MKLSPKQQAFVDEYLIDLNANQAAIRAGYSASKSNNNRYRLCNHPLIKAEIAARMAERGQQWEIKQERVLQEIARLAFNDPRRIFTANGALLPVHEWPDEVAAAVSSIKIHEIKDSEGNAVGECKEIKFWDKGKQLELAARHLGMLQDKLEISTPVAQMIRAARERIRTVNAMETNENE